MSSRSLVARLGSTVRPARRALETRSVDLRTLTPEQTEQLVDDTYRIFAGIFGRDFELPSRDQFERTALWRTGDDPVVGLLYDGERMVGFFPSSIESIRISRRDYAVFSAAAYVEREYKGGGRHMARFGMQRALRYKARHPFARLYCATEAMHPVIYRRFATSLGKLYPSPDHAFPTQLQELLRAAIHRRGRSFPFDGSWVSDRFLVKRHGYETVRVTREDRFTRYYGRVNPHVHEGHGLYVLMPLDVPNVIVGALKLLVNRR